MKQSLDVLARTSAVPLIRQLDISTQVTKLGDAFQSFYREGTSTQSSTLRATARRLAQHWKSTLVTIRRLRDGGPASLSTLISDNFDSVHAVLLAIDDNPDVFDYDILHRSAEQFQSSLTGLRENFQGLFATFPNSAPEDYWTGIIREFVNDFNEAFYTILPKSEKSPEVLSRMKAEFISACNQITRAVPSFFSLGTDFAKIWVDLDATHTFLEQIMSRLGIGALPRLAKQTIKQDFSPEYAKFEAFIARLWSAVHDHPAPRGADLAEALPQLETVAFERISQKTGGSLRPADSKSRTPEDISKWEQEKRLLEEKITEVSKLAELRLRQLEDVLSAKRIHAIEEVGRIMGDMMIPVAETVIKNEPEIEHLDKINVFVLERRCSKCREYEEEARDIRRRLRGILQIRPGESLMSIFDALSSQNMKARKEIAKMKSAEEAVKRALDERGAAIARANEALAKYGIHITGDDASEIVLAILDALEPLLEGHQKELRDQEAALEERHTRDLEYILKAVSQIMPDIIESGRVSITDFKTTIIMVAREAVTRMDEVRQEDAKREELLGTVQTWLHGRAVEVTESDMENLTYHETIPLLMNALDRTPNPLVPKMNAMKNQIAQIECEFRDFLGQAKRDGFIANTLDLNVMELYELMNVNRSFQATVMERIESVKREMQMQLYEIDQTKESLLIIAKRLRRLLRHDDVELDGQETAELFMHIQTFLEELSSGGTANLYMSIADINDMTKAARKIMNCLNVTDPRQYLPDVIRLFEDNVNTIESSRKFAGPLDAIFKSFDFQAASFNPDSDAFKFLREQIFQMHVVLGSDGTLIHDAKLTDVFKRMISLSAALMSYIAQLYLGGDARSGRPSEAAAPAPAGGAPF
jgi:hypothetical protein